ncbi:MAG: lytic transglycosylase domain-containing protein [Chitinophagaceae bacterium]|nr:lytic transglycosylase domain-containing protein [Chitinophagaceae bacterium]MBK9531591.1 lytic transglycosylase domain-containing protein [Chitinophagaceae bacterium]
MRQFIYIIFLQLLFITAKAGSTVNIQQPPATTDTSIITETIDDAIIAEVIKTKAPPEKEKVQYFSQVTKYGFKNLFAKYNYNPALPYSSQVNPHAESYMQDYLKSHSNNLIKMKGWGQPYFNLIDNVLSQYGLPRELKYLAVIESNLSTKATSWVGAGGPWQFMPYTARDYGLVVNNVLDERRDYYKSTHAAARYLLTLYGQMKDWLLVIAAYNGGPGRVYSAIKKSGSRNFWSLQYYLPTESRNHVKKFIATHYIMEGTGGVTTVANVKGNYDLRGGVNSYDVKPNLTEEEKEYASTQSITGRFNSLVISKNLLMDIATFNRYNPDFDNLMSINGNYDLRLPADKMQLFLANKYVILNECVQLLLGDNPEPPPNQSVTYPFPKSTKKRGR